MKRIGILPNPDKDKGLLGAKRVIERVNEKGLTPVISRSYASQNWNAEYTEEEKVLETDLVITLGGDGTLLSAARSLIGKNTPILGINFGHLGFLTALEADEMDKLDRVLDGEFRCEEHNSLLLRIMNGEKEVARFSAINDISLHRRERARILGYSTYIDDEYVNTLSADGMLASTSLGSTAYAMSAGGPIADPQLPIILMTPICPHALHTRSILIPQNRTLKIVVEEGGNDSVIAMDGQEWYMLNDNEHLEISFGESIVLARLHNFSFYKTLSNKFYFGR